MGQQTTFLQVANNAQSTLNGSITNVATTINVASTHGARFPSPGNGFYCTIWDANTYADPFSDPYMEVVKVTARSSDALTVTRAQRGTSGVAHSSGDKIALLADSTALSDLTTAVNNLERLVDNTKGNGIFDDLHMALTTGTVTWTNDWTTKRALVTCGGPGTTTISTRQTAARPGVVALGTGASSGAGASILALPQSLLAGGGELAVEWGIYIENLSTVGEEYIIRAGFGDTTVAAAVDGAYLEYDRLTSVNWCRVTASNSSRTKNASSTAVAAGAWTKVKTVINAAGTSVEYFVDGTSIGTETTNIPTGAGRYFGAFCHIIKSAGTTERLLHADYYHLYADLTTAR